jgi:hypothetical protein
MGLGSRAAGGKKKKFCRPSRGGPAKNVYTTFVLICKQTNAPYMIYKLGMGYEKKN